MPWSGRSSRTAAVLAAVALAASACGGVRDLGSEDPAVLQNEWWEWVVTTPVDRHPVTDTTGEHCAENQPDDAWFLAATFGDVEGTVARTCAIPAGRPILVPAVSILSRDAPVFETGPPSVLGCVEVMGQMSGTITLDGEDVVLERVDGSRIGAIGVMGNPVSGDASGVTGAGCGLWARIEPLAAGTHTLVIRGDAPGFTAAVDYALTVAE